MAGNWPAAPPSSCLSLAERFIYHAGKQHLQPRDIEQTLTVLRDETFSWEDALDLAQRHWVLPLIAGNLHAQRDLHAHVPPAVDRILRLAQFGARVRTTAILSSFNAAAEELSAQKVVFAFMKGAALCRTIYRPGWRPLNDIDVLARKRDYCTVQDALMRHGFEPEPRLAKAHQISFVRPWSDDGPLVVDLHWEMHDHLGLELDTEELLVRATDPAKSLGTSGPVLSVEDSLVQYGSQLVVDFLRTNALRLADIHALASHGPNWELLVDIAVRSGAAGPSFVALTLAADRGAPVPDAVFAQLGGACPGCREVADILRDPRWPFGRWALARPAKYVLLRGLHASSRHRVGSSQARQVRAAFWGRLGTALRKHWLRTVGTMLGGAAWVVQMWIARWALRFGAAGLAGRLRGAFWRFGEVTDPPSRRSLAEDSPEMSDNKS